MAYSGAHAAGQGHIRYFRDDWRFRNDAPTVLLQEALKMEKEETVNHPKHYGGDTPHETIKCLNAWGLEGDALLWNAVKYISRAGKKGLLLEDLKKARFYLDRRIQTLEK